MKLQKLYVIAMSVSSVLLLSGLMAQILNGTFFIFTTIGFFTYILVSAYITQKELNVLNKQMLNELELSKNSFNFKEFLSLFEYSSLITILTDSNFVVLWQNKIASDNPHFSQIKIGEENFRNLVDTDAENKLLEVAAIASNQAVVPPLELRLENKSKTIVLHITKININNVKNFVLQIIDITDHKTLETDFAHSQKMQALGQLSGAIAHDFNNLLTAIIGFSDLLLIRHPPGDQSFTEVMQIKQNAHRAANLVRQLLAFSRKQVMQPTIINVTDTIAELAHLLKRLIGNAVTLEIEHANDLWKVKVDQGQLEQVITNLAVNARDAMPYGGKLLINTKNVKVDQSYKMGNYFAPKGSSPILPGNYVLISITDTGTGIDNNILDKIFEPFFSTKNLSLGNSGIGLGLATVSGIMEQIGGYIRLKTQLDKGTAFYIFLKSTDSHEEQAQVEEEKDHTVVYNITPKAKILIVEDDVPVRMFTVHALRSKGFKIFEAGSGDEAIATMKKIGKEIDVLITDVVMRGMDGTELVERIRFDYPKLKVIFISGYAQDAISYLSNSNYTFLSKPYTLKELVTTVNELMQDNQANKKIEAL